MVPVLIILFGALALFLSTDTVQAQSIQILSYHAGDTISYTGHTTPGSTVTIAASTSSTTSVGSDLNYERKMGPITIPSCSIDIAVYSVQTVTFGATPYVMGVRTVEVTKSVSFSGTAGRFVYSAPGGTYDVRIFGKAATGTSGVRMDISVSQQVTADGSGDYTMSISSAGLPSGVYTITANGKAVARVYLDTPAPQTYTLSLNKGWNIISLPIVPEDNKITSIFSEDQLNNVINVIWDYNGGNWLYFTRRPGLTSQFSTLSVNKGYYVYCKAPISVQIVGSAGSGVIPYSSLPKGWNLIGYPSTSATDISSVYGNAYVIWKIEGGNWYYYTTRPGLKNQFTTLTPGHGYWINKKQ